MSRLENPPFLRRDELQIALGLKGLSGKLITRMLFGILGMEKANRIYAMKPRPENGPAFSAAILEDLDVTYDIPENQLDFIPAKGGFITVSNHHFGAIDGMILNKVIGSRRADYRILTTFFLSLIPNLKDWFIPVDNFASGGAKSVSGIRAALGHIADGGALGFFPAGEVATWQKGRVVEDKPWADNIIKLIKKSGLPVVPIYFDGENSRTFHILGRIHPRLRTMRLVRELTGARGKHIKVRIGQPIPASQIAGLDKEALGTYLRNRCYALEAQCLPDFGDKPSASNLEPIIPPVEPELVRSLMAGMEDKAVFEAGDYKAYLIEAGDAPDVMRELYRLREVTFRAVGEGTGKALDTDHYDNYYHHLILWNIPNGEIVGAYRLGYGQDILARHGGIKGFYTASLVAFGPDAEDVLSHSMELGRSFVVEKYQREVLPLKLLLAGLCVATTKNPMIDRCVGLVTMSAALPDFYKSLTAYFLQRDFLLDNADKFTAPTTPFTPGYLRVDPEGLLAQIPMKDIDAFDRLMGTLSDGKYRLPVLFRKYFSCGAHVSCMNVDADFSDCVDAMIVLRLADFPPVSIKSFVRSLPEEIQRGVLRHFYGTDNI